MDPRPMNGPAARLTRRSRAPYTPPHQTDARVAMARVRRLLRRSQIKQLLEE